VVLLLELMPDAWVLSQALPSLRDRSTDDNAYYTRSALAQGWKVSHLPSRLEDQPDLSELFRELPAPPTLCPAVWVGFVPSQALYQQVYEEALRRNLRLLNTPAEHQRAFELHLAYPFLEGLTPKTVAVTDPSQCRAALVEVPLPVFVKGSLASRKEASWGSCVARTEEELVERVTALLRDPRASRGRAMIRELVPLRQDRVPAQDFPVGREYRVFLYRGEVLSFGFYWLYEFLFPPLTPEEERAMLALAVEGARRLGVPYVSLDLGQLEDGRFVIVEPGDPQFSGPSLMPLDRMWRRLKQLVGE
jgi:hypothetical protein